MRNHPERKKLLVKLKVRDNQPFYKTSGLFMFRHYDLSWMPDWQNSVTPLVARALKTEINNSGYETAEKELLIPLIERMNEVLPEGRKIVMTRSDYPLRKTRRVV